MNKIKLIIVFVFAILFLQGCSENKIEIHHLFPQEFRAFFATKGINVDDYGVNLTKKQHRGSGPQSLHGSRWNQEWKTFLINNQNISKNGLDKQLSKMLKERDYVGRINYINYVTKKPTGRFLDSFGSGIIGFLGVLGNFIIVMFGASSATVAFLAWLGSGVIFTLGFGSKVEAGIAVGLGALIVFVALGVTIWIIYPWLYALMVSSVLVGGAIVGGSSSSSGADHDYE